MNKKIRILLFLYFLFFKCNICYSGGSSNTYDDYWLGGQVNGGPLWSAIGYTDSGDGIYLPMFSAYMTTTWKTWLGIPYHYRDESPVVTIDNTNKYKNINIDFAKSASPITSDIYGGTFRLWVRHHGVGYYYVDSREDTQYGSDSNVIIKVPAYHLKSFSRISSVPSYNYNYNITCVQTLMDFYQTSFTHGISIHNLLNNTTSYPNFAFDDLLGNSVQLTSGKYHILMNTKNTEKSTHQYNVPTNHLFKKADHTVQFDISDKTIIIDTAPPTVEIKSISMDPDISYGNDALTVYIKHKITGDSAAFFSKVLAFFKAIQNPDNIIADKISKTYSLLIDTATYKKGEFDKTPNSYQNSDYINFKQKYNDLSSYLISGTLPTGYNTLDDLLRAVRKALHKLVLYHSDFALLTFDSEDLLLGKAIIEHVYPQNDTEEQSLADFFDGINTTYNDHYYTNHNSVWWDEIPIIQYYSGFNADEMLLTVSTAVADGVGDDTDSGMTWGSSQLLAMDARVGRGLGECSILPLIGYDLISPGTPDRCKFSTNFSSETIILTDYYISLANIAQQQTYEWLTPLYVPASMNIMKGATGNVPAIQGRSSNLSYYLYSPKLAVTANITDYPANVWSDGPQKITADFYGNDNSSLMEKHEVSRVWNDVNEKYIEYPDTIRGELKRMWNSNTIISIPDAGSGSGYCSIGAYDGDNRYVGENSYAPDYNTLSNSAVVNYYVDATPPSIVISTVQYQNSNDMLQVSFTSNKSGSHYAIWGLTTRTHYDAAGIPDGDAIDEFAQIYPYVSTETPTSIVYNNIKTSNQWDKLFIEDRVGHSDYFQTSEGVLRDVYIPLSEILKKLNCVTLEQLKVIVVIQKDKTGRAIAVSYPVQFDVSVPNLAFSRWPPAVSSSSVITFVGTAEDNDSVKELRYDYTWNGFNGEYASEYSGISPFGKKVAFPISPEVLDTDISTYPFVFNFNSAVAPADGYGDGTYSFTFYLYDQHDNYVTYPSTSGIRSSSVTITIDSHPPELQVNSIQGLNYQTYLVFSGTSEYQSSVWITVVDPISGQEKFLKNTKSTIYGGATNVQNGVFSITVPVGDIDDLIKPASHVTNPALKFIVYSNDGVNQVTSTQTYTFDTSVPGIATGSTDSVWTNTDPPAFTINGTVSNTSKLTYTHRYLASNILGGYGTDMTPSPNEIDIIDGVFHLTKNNLNEGTHNITFNASNDNTITNYQYTVYADTEAPTIQKISTPQQQTNKDITYIECSTYDNFSSTPIKIEIGTGSDSPSIYASAFSWPGQFGFYLSSGTKDGQNMPCLMEEGVPHYFKLRCKDAAGNYSGWSSSFSVIKDWSSPKISFNDKKMEYEYGISIASTTHVGITGYAYDANLSKINYSIIYGTETPQYSGQGDYNKIETNTGIFTVTGPTTPFTLDLLQQKEGYHIVLITAEDLFSNTNSKMIIINLDLTPPLMGWLSGTPVINGNEVTLTIGGEVGSAFGIYSNPDFTSLVSSGMIGYQGLGQTTLILPIGTHALYILAQDTAGNSTYNHQPFYITISANKISVPKIIYPADNIVVRSSRPTIYGTGTAGAYVTIRLNGNMISEVPATIAGDWEYTVATASGLADGYYYLTVQARSADYMSYSEVSQWIRFSVKSDSIQGYPVIRFDNSVLENNQWEYTSAVKTSSCTGNIFDVGIDTNTVQYSYTISTSNINYGLYYDSPLIFNATMYSLILTDNKFSIPMQNAEGTHIIRVKASNNLGNTSKRIAVMVFDTSPPPMTIFTGAPVVNGNEITLVLQGEAYSIANVYSDANFTNLIASTTLNSSGVGYVTFLDTIGQHDYYVQAVDQSGNPTNNPSTIHVTVSTLKPGKPVITKPGQGGTVTPKEPFLGTATPNAIIVIYFDGQQMDNVQVNPSGHWEYTVKEPMAEGWHYLKVRVYRDMAVSDESDTVMFNVKATAGGKDGMEETLQFVGPNTIREGSTVVYRVIDKKTNAPKSGVAVDFMGDKYVTNNQGIVGQYRSPFIPGVVIKIPTTKRAILFGSPARNIGNIEITAKLNSFKTVQIGSLMLSIIPQNPTKILLSPNGDGINDKVIFSGNKYPIRVFNIRGRKITDINDETGWDGKDSDGNELPTDVYLWEDADGNKGRVFIRR